MHSRAIRCNITNSLLNIKISVISLLFDNCETLLFIGIATYTDPSKIWA